MDPLLNTMSSNAKIDAAAVMFGAACGALCRWSISESHTFKHRPYLAILAVNGVGSFVLGSVFGYSAMKSLNPRISLL